MENSQGDQPPEKNMIGPSLPFSQSLLFDGQPDCQRSTFGGTEIETEQLVLSSSMDIGFATGRLRRTSSELCKDLETQLKGCFEAPALSSSFFLEEPVVADYAEVESEDAQALESPECYFVPTMEETHEELSTSESVYSSLEFIPCSEGHEVAMATDQVIVNYICRPQSADRSSTVCKQPAEPVEVSLEACSLSGSGVPLLLPSSTPPPAYSQEYESKPGPLPQDGCTQMDTAITDQDISTSTPLLDHPFMTGEAVDEAEEVTRDSIFEPALCSQTHVTNLLDLDFLDASMENLLNYASDRVNEPASILEDVMLDFDGLVVVEEPEDSCSLLVATSQPGSTSAKVEREEEIEEQSTGCCLFSCTHGQ